MVRISWIEILLNCIWSQKSSLDTSTFITFKTWFQRLKRVRRKAVLYCLEIVLFFFLQLVTGFQMAQPKCDMKTALIYRKCPIRDRLTIYQLSYNIIGSCSGFQTDSVLWWTFQFAVVLLAYSMTKEIICRKATLWFRYQVVQVFF